MRLIPAAFLMLVVPLAGARAQSEAVLRRAFEGQSVVVRIDMPGTNTGVNIYPEQEMPIDFPEVAARLKRFGTAIRAGDAVMVTKIKVKPDLIEFQLGGGGYGTFGDNMGSSSYGATEAGPSPAERALEDSIRRSTSDTQKRRMQRDLEGLRAARERDNAQARAAAAQAEEIRQANLRGRRVEGGSRFNIRYRRRVPAHALTPDGLRQALGRYVDFDASTGPAESDTRPSVTTLRKGLTLEEVEGLLGPAVTATEAETCALKVVTRVYRRDGQRTTARFVSGVLVEYMIAPE